MHRAQWSLGLVGIDANVYASQWVHACLYAWVGMFTTLDLMSPPLESAPLPLKSAPLDTAQPLSACSPLEVVVLGVCEYLMSGVYNLFTVILGL